jgi:hypothetical protein
MIRKEIDCRCGAVWKLSDFVDNEQLINGLEVNADLLEECKGLQGALIRVLDKYDPDSLEYEWVGHSNEAINRSNKRER